MMMPKTVILFLSLLTFLNATPPSDEEISRVLIIPTLEKAQEAKKNLLLMAHIQTIFIEANPSLEVSFARATEKNISPIQTLSEAFEDKEMSKGNIHNTIQSAALNFCVTTSSARELKLPEAWTHPVGQAIPIFDQIIGYLLMKTKLWTQLGEPFILNYPENFDIKNDGYHFTGVFRIALKERTVNVVYSEN